MWAGRAARATVAIRRRRTPDRTTPSWSRTATPSAVSHTSLSMPVAPRRSASRNASMAVVKPAESRIVELLVQSGVRLLTWRLPAELFERREGPPIDHDDLLDFHQLLEDDGWFDQLSSMVGF